MTPTQTMHKCSQENPPLQMTIHFSIKFNPPKKGPIQNGWNWRVPAISQTCKGFLTIIQLKQPTI